MVLFIIEIFNMDSSARQKTVQLVRNAFNIFNVHLKRVLKLIESEKEMKNKREVMSILELLCDSNLIQSEYKIFKYLESAGYLIYPKAHLLSIDQRETILNESILVTKIQVIFYTSATTLQYILFYNTCIIDTIIDFLVKMKNYPTIPNVINSKLCRTKTQYFDKQDNILYLPIFIYFDDFEPLNSLGSHSGTYKLGTVYIKIACLPEHLQSRLFSMFLAMVFFSNDRRDFGNSRVFTPLINELNLLADVGIEIDHEQYKTVKFITVGVLGDNLGINSVLGFVESFRANYFCRLCISPKEICDSIFAIPMNLY